MEAFGPLLLLDESEIKNLSSSVLKVCVNIKSVIWSLVNISPAEHFDLSYAFVFYFLSMSKLLLLLLLQKYSKYKTHHLHHS